jgi:rare lipoprotein A (peptidoglycan hydrolase)
VHTFSIGRHRAALSLLLAGSFALITAQQLLGSVADAQMTRSVVDVQELQPPTATESASTSTVISAAVPAGQFEDASKPTPVPVPTAAPTPVPTARTLYESGIASTYGEGDGFEGQRTACGQVFHTTDVQIAHKSLPCGTRVLVEDTSTGRSVEASVTDRGPYVAGRIVDLSWGAFRELDSTGPGLLQVNVYVLE